MKTQNNLVYCGSFTTTQTDGNKKLLNYGAPTYSKKQNELYSRALVGLKAYTPEELYAMNSTKKNKIKRVHKRAQKLLNEFKHLRSIQLIKETVQLLRSNRDADNYRNEELRGLFTDLLSHTEKDANIKNDLSFKELSIKKEDIIQLWMQNNILPHNFLSL